MTAILQAIIDTELAIVRALLKANQRSGAIDAFDRLERHVGNGPLLSEVKQLRARLLEGA
jgi:hypothetical protein